MMLTIVDSAPLDLEVVLAVGEGAPDDVRVTPCITALQFFWKQAVVDWTKLVSKHRQWTSPG